MTCIGGLEAVDDGGFPAVVQPETQNVHLLLQAQPSCQLIKQPHWLVIHHLLLLLSPRKRAESKCKQRFHGITFSTHISTCRCQQQDNLVYLLARKITEGQKIAPVQFQRTYMVQHKQS